MKVLLLSVPAGGGHYQTARAVCDYLNTLDNAQCEILDIAENTNGFVKGFISNGYLFTTTALPAGYRFFYNLMNKRTKHSFTFVSRLLYWVCGKKLVKYIESYKPDVVVSTHPFATVVLNIHAKKHKLNTKIISIITDLTIQPMWEQTTSDYFITASDLLSYQALVKWGSCDNVLPLGIPISTKFSQKTEKAQARASLSFPDKFTVLVMMGSMGYGSAAAKLIRELDSLTDDFHIIAVCGNNKTLKARIEKLKINKSLTAYGFVNNVADLMDTADCIITKPGGLSSSEALAKNLPIILANPIPGHEDRNQEFLVNNGAAVALSKTFKVSEAVYQLIHSENMCKRLSENAHHLAKPDATRNLAELILNIKS